MTNEKWYHFDEDRTKSAVNGNMSTYSKMKEWYKELQPYFLAENYIVKNCNPSSKLDAFPFMKYEDAIKAASSRLGDVENERTHGMYSTYEDKINEYQKKNNPNATPPDQAVQTTKVVQNPVIESVQPSPVQQEKIIISTDGRPIKH
jgi:hypothetical protein